MYSMVFSDSAQAGIQWVLWAVLAVFFVLVILGWLVASRSWVKEDEKEPGPDSPEEHSTGTESAHS